MPGFPIANRTKRILLGLIGSPIAHSAAPAMHEAAARAAGIDLHYHLIEVSGATRDDLSAMLDGVRRLGFSGVNVTFPYKEAVIPLLDALSPDAGAMGAVNTVVAREGKLTGHNTDATGFATAYRALGRADGDAPVAIIGAGGVGKAIGFALASCGVTRLRLFDPDRAKCEALAAQLVGRAQVEIAETVEAAVADAAGIVNGSPIGMLPSRDTPVPATLLRAGHWVADAVYHPLWTPLLIDARNVGATVMTGRELSIHQAVDAFALFTGATAPYEAIATAFDRSLAAQEAKRHAA